jgi:hypothetical protein
VLVLLCIHLAQANTSVEIHVTELIAPAPAGIHWLITALAVFIERLCTAYLPPIWGWATLVWLRRRDYV